MVGVVTERDSAQTGPGADGHPFLGRTVQRIDDLNPDERLYLFEQTRRLKRAVRDRDESVMDEFRIGNPDFGLYEVFLEDSTRTRESFKNAAGFHRIKSLELNCDSSSFNKSESYADTFANLIGYNNQVFVVRSRLEGVCRHLADSTAAYIARQGFPKWVSFINAGDGRHEHPTQELLDEFTFLEDLDWRPEAIHLAMVGDLYHGRTVHSKVHGLGLFKSVRVDLVAPRELAMPAHYVRMMREQGFEVREYESIREYVRRDDVAPQWYFTRPQLERMGDRVLRRQDELRASITCDDQTASRLDGHTVFYHPLPRHREHPTIPASLDSTSLNGWERQSANGWYVRIALLSLIAGRIGSDYAGPVGSESGEDPEFVHEVPANDGSPKQYSEGIRPIGDGIVIDHVRVGSSPDEIRRHIRTILSVLKLNGKGGEWISSGSDGRYKGLIFRPGHPDLSESEIKRLAAVTPGATLNVVRNGSVDQKLRLSMPARIYGMEALVCANEACISNPGNHEPVGARFRRTGDRYACEFCDTEYEFTEIWS